MMLLYVFCHDEDSEAQANILCDSTVLSCVNRLKILRLPSSKYFESQFWTDPYWSLENIDRWNDHEYVGFISYKYTIKTKSTLDDIDIALKKNQGSDVIALYDYDNDLLAHACHVHGTQFASIWKALLSDSFPKDDIFRKDLPAFYCNFWLAKPTVLLSYRSFANNLIRRIESSQDLSDMLYLDSGYRGNLPRYKLRALTGHDHYTFHPFLFERLPCIFFYLTEAKIGRRRFPERPWQVWRPFPFDTVSSLLGHKANLTLALFATHSVETFFSNNTKSYINDISKEFDIVIVISTQKSIDNAGDLPDNCRVMLTENSCHDFGLHFRVLHHLDMSCVQEVGVFNDSCWLLKPSHAAIYGLRALKGDMLGFTDSYEVTYHLQSYLLLFRGGALNILQTFVRNACMYPLRMTNKWYVIRHFEIGLSNYMIKQGVQLGALYPLADVWRIDSPFKGHGTNTSFSCWDRLLLMGSPLLKKARKTFDAEYNFIRKFTEM